MQVDAAAVRVEFLLITEAAATLARKRIHEPEPCVVQRSFVFVLGISETGDDTNGFAHSVAMLIEIGNKKTAQRRSFRKAYE
jgi:hypothetical protein